MKIKHSSETIVSHGNYQNILFGNYSQSWKLPNPIRSVKTSGYRKTSNRLAIISFSSPALSLQLYLEDQNDIPKLFPLASLSGTLINSL